MFAYIANASTSSPLLPPQFLPVTAVPHLQMWLTWFLSQLPVCRRGLSENVWVRFRGLFYTPAAWLLLLLLLQGELSPLLTLFNQASRRGALGSIHLFSGPPWFHLGHGSSNCLSTSWMGLCSALGLNCQSHPERLLSKTSLGR